MGLAEQALPDFLSGVTVLFYQLDDVCLESAPRIMTLSPAGKPAQAVGSVPGSIWRAG
jgi:hypothetical protein